MLGSAAARHLAKDNASVAVVGPGEPAEKASHDGVFASHYDQARVTRRLDSDADWSRLTMRSIDRYDEIAQESGETFFHETGSIMAGPKSGPGSVFIANSIDIGKRHGIFFDTLEGTSLRDKFPYLEFPNGIVALYERSGAGYIDPRAHVRAELKAAEKAGAVYVDAEAVAVEELKDGVDVRCSDNRTYRARQVVVACGGFSAQPGLLPMAPPMRIFSRTVALFELDAAECARLAGMPSLVYLPPDLACDSYILPPVAYEDGRHYLKIGGDPEDIALTSMNEIKDWFRSDGDADVRDFLARQLLKLMPSLRYRRISSASCVTSYTETGKPLIYRQSERIVALTGGNGAGAKCADELGRLGATVAAGRSTSAEEYDTDFCPDG